MLRRQFLAGSVLPAFGRMEARSLILVWLAGGVSQTDTWEPLPYTPFRRGMRAGDVLGTCRSIATSNPDLRFGEGLERLAEVAHLGRIVRYPALPGGVSHREATDAAMMRWNAAGARRTIAWPFEPFAGFDVHDHGAARMMSMKRRIDAPLAKLIRETDLATTTVVIASEFGRKLALDPATPLLDESQYGYHAHAPEIQSALVFGAAL